MVWHHSGDATFKYGATIDVSHKERERKCEREKRERERLDWLERTREKRERDKRASTAERGEIHMGTKREVKKSCRSVPFERNRESQKERD